MSFQILIFLYVYYAFLALWGIFSLVAIYHMLKFGFKNFVTFFTTFVFIGISFFILGASFYYINGIDWETEISLFGGLNNQIQGL